MVVFGAAAVAEEDEADAMAEVRRVGSSRMSERRSALRERSRAVFRRSSTVFSVLRREYFSENVRVALSRFGMSSRRVVAWKESVGRAVRSDERWEEEATRAALERAVRD